MKIWLHGRPNMKAADDETSVLIWDRGAVAGVANGSTAWTLATGNANAADMNGTNIQTDFDDNAHVRYTIEDDQTWATSGDHDFVWIQISVDIPDGASTASATGNLRFYFEATTINIKKCKELIERLEQTSFGILSRNIISKVEKKDWKDQKNRELQEEDKIVIDEVEKSYKNKYYDIQVRYDELQEEYNNLKEALENKIEDPYEDKYHNLKQSYEELQEEYEELKLAVEKLLWKNEI